MRAFFALFEGLWKHRKYSLLTGTVEHIVYQKEESGFTVLELASADELITVVGEMPGVAEGEELVLHWKLCGPSYLWQSVSGIGL